MPRGAGHVHAWTPELSEKKISRQARDASYRFGPTRFSVIPRVAVGNVSIRFVPDQDADKLIDLLRHVLASVHTPNPTLTIRPDREPQAFCRLYSRISQL